VSVRRAARPTDAAVPVSGTVSAPTNVSAPATIIDDDGSTASGTLVLRNLLAD
jgi:hypothetical protein